jgi:hypothetical protein
MEKMECLKCLNLETLQQEGELQEHARFVSHYLSTAYKASTIKTHVLPLLNWLTTQRNSINESTTWKLLIKKLKDSIPVPPCSLKYHFLSTKNDQNETIQFSECTPNHLHVLCSFPVIFRKIMIQHASNLKQNKTGEELFQDIQNSVQETLVCQTHVILPFK